MASYYLYESQAEKLRGLKTPATQELARAVERYLAGEFTKCLAFLEESDFAIMTFRSRIIRP